jgi:fructose-bisphosphate aldolase class II
MNDFRFVTLTAVLFAAEKHSQHVTPAAIGAFNANFRSQVEGILEGLRRAEALGIIQASRGACKFQHGPEQIVTMVEKAMAESRHTLPVCLHLDHGDARSAISCASGKFSSVMIDASDRELGENIGTTRAVVQHAHSRGVSVEGELGRLAGIEEDISNAQTTYADPTLVPYFFKATGADALAIAYGTQHGPNKQGMDKLAIHIVKQSYEGMKSWAMQDEHFLVSHGSSTVPQYLVNEINEYGGKLVPKNTKGVPMAKLREAIASGIRKINIDTDLRLGITATFRKFFVENKGIEETSEILKAIKQRLDAKPREFDPRYYLEPVDRELLRDPPTGDLEEVMTLVRAWIAGHVESLVRDFGSAGLANEVATRRTDA